MTKTKSKNDFSEIITIIENALLRIIFIVLIFCLL